MVHFLLRKIKLWEIRRACIAREKADKLSENVLIRFRLNGEALQ